jgi:uncharacterized membrane protein
MAALTLAAALLCLVVVVDTGRLYLEKRNLQRVADMAALEAATRGGDCLAGTSAVTYATASAQRNGFAIPSVGRGLAVACGVVNVNAGNIRVFAADASKSEAIQVIASHRVPQSLAGGLGAMFGGAPANSTINLSATAVAGVAGPPVAQLSIRSTLADVNLLNGMLSGLSGAPINLTLASWNGLVAANINLLKYMDQLAIDLHVTAGDYTQLLGADATVGQLLRAAATVAQANGATADVQTGLNALASTVVNPLKVHLGDILQLQTGSTASGLNANVNAFQLVQAFIELGNSKSPVTGTLPVNLLGLGLGATANIKVIEPPQLSVVGNPALAKLAPLGANRIYVRTAQVRVLVSLDLSLITNLTSLVSGILSVVVAPLGLDLRVLPDHNLDVSLEAGGGSSYVTDYTCASETNKSLTAFATTTVAELRVGRVNSDWASSTAPMSVTPYTLLDIRHAGVPFSGGGAEVRIDSPVLPASASTTFINPPKVGLAPSNPPYTLMATNAISGLSQAINPLPLIVHTPSFSPGFLLQVVFDLLNSLLTSVFSLLTTTLSSILSPLLDNLLNTVLKTLGIEVGKIQVGANLSCHSGRASLLI